MEQLSALIAVLQTYVAAHPLAACAVSAAAGAASAHRRQLFRLFVLSIVAKFPAILGRKDEILADLDEVRAELKKDLDEAEARRQAAAKPVEPAKQG